MPSADMEDHSFYFVQISDTHLASSRSFRDTAAVVDAVNRLPMPVAFVAHTGDIMYNNIDVGDAARVGRQVFADLQMPIHFIPGNHDILSSRFESTTATYRRHFGALCYAVACQGVALVFTDTGPLAGTYGNEQQAFGQVERHLEAAGDKPTVVFAHHPPLDTLVKNSHFKGGWPPASRRRWIDLLNDYGVEAVISGHYHQELQLWLGNVPLYVASSIGAYPPSFRLYRYDRGQLSFWTGQIAKKPLAYRVLRKWKKLIHNGLNSNHSAQRRGT